MNLLFNVKYLNKGFCVTLSFLEQLIRCKSRASTDKNKKSIDTSEV